MKQTEDTLVNRFESFIKELQGTISNTYREVDKEKNDAQRELFAASTVINKTKTELRKGKSKAVEAELEDATKKKLKAESKLTTAEDRLKKLRNLTESLTNTQLFCESEIVMNRSNIEGILNNLTHCISEKDFNKLLTSINTQIEKTKFERTILFEGSKNAYIRIDTNNKTDLARMGNEDLEFQVDNLDGTHNDYKGKFSKILNSALVYGKQLIDDNFTSFKIEYPENANFQLSDNAKKALDTLKERAKMSKRQESDLRIRHMSLNIPKIEKVLITKEIIEQSISLYRDLKNELIQVKTQTHLKAFRNDKNKKLTTDPDFSKIISNITKTLSSLENDLIKTNKTLETLGISTNVNESGSIEYAGIVTTAATDLATLSRHNGREVKIEVFNNMPKESVIKNNEKSPDENNIKKAEALYRIYLESNSNEPFRKWCKDFGYEYDESIDWLEIDKKLKYTTGPGEYYNDIRKEASKDPEIEMEDDGMDM